MNEELQQTLIPLAFVAVVAAVIFLWNVPKGKYVLLAIAITFVFAGVARGTAYLDELDGGNAQVIQMVQPSGNDPVTDAQYADINAQNADSVAVLADADNGTTETNSKAFLRYSIMALLFFVVPFFLLVVTRKS